MPAFPIRRYFGRLAAWTNLPAAIAVVVFLIAGIYADRQNRHLAEQALRASVAKEVNLIRAKLEGNVNANLQLVRGLVATIATEPDMGQARFAQLAESLLREETQLRNIAGAPDMVISLMYPMPGNEKALGLDYRSDPLQRDAALRARDRKELVLAGPVNLKQGGQGFVGRFPVFVNRGYPTERFWGIVAAVIDVERLYRDSGLLDPNLPIEIALTGKDALGRQGSRFYGPQEVVANDPFTAEVRLPTGSWQISAVPKGGWVAAPAEIWLLRTIMLIGGALVVIPVAVVGQLLGERHRHYRELRRSERQQRQLSQRLEMALDASHIGVWEHDLETHVMHWDDRVNEIYGKPADGKPRALEDWAGTIHPDDLDHAKRDFERGVATGRYASQYRLKLPDGVVKHVRTRAKCYADGGDTKMIGAEWDVTADVTLTQELERAKQLAETRNAELEAAKSRIQHTALHDALTGLPNRRYLDEVLGNADPNHPIGAGGVAVMHIDLDRFKRINDMFGHAVGDAMLVHASKLLVGTVRSGDFVARVGGDEFVVLCRSAVGAEQLAELARRIIDRIRQPVPYEGHQCRFGVSIGIAVDETEAPDLRKLLVNADIALYRAKNRGRSRYEFFTDTLQAEITRTNRIADEILVALERNEFVPYYQLQFDAATLEVAGVEALARWNHPTEGLLTPASFLRIAESLDVVSTIDRFILEQTLRDFDAWTRAGLPVPRVSVNVSARRLQDEELIASLGSLPIRPGTLSFELVESIFLDDSDELVIWNVDRIKELGIDVEIDDFGTGYASIVSLLKLKPRRLKIDRQLIEPITASARQRQVVHSIIQIGKSLGIEVAAEGVETMKHAEILKKLGCGVLQGYALSHPMDAAVLAQFLGRRMRRAAS